MYVDVEQKMASRGGGMFPAGGCCPSIWLVDQMFLLHTLAATYGDGDGDGDGV